MEEHLNQVVPSTSCDWLDQFDDESSSNQVVPATMPMPVPTFSPGIALNPVVGDSVLQPLALPALDAAQNNSSCSSVIAIENSLKSLSLEGIQVVPSASRSPTVETLTMEVEMRTCVRKILRPASKTSASKA